MKRLLRSTEWTGRYRRNMILLLWPDRSLFDPHGAIRRTDSCRFSLAQIQNGRRLFGLEMCAEHLTSANIPWRKGRTPSRHFKFAISCWKTGNGVVEGSLRSPQGFRPHPCTDLGRPGCIPVYAFNRTRSLDFDLMRYCRWVLFMLWLVVSGRVV